MYKDWRWVISQDLKCNEFHGILQNIGLKLNVEASMDSVYPKRLVLIWNCSSLISVIKRISVNHSNFEVVGQVSDRVQVDWRACQIVVSEAGQSGRTTTLRSFQMDGIKEAHRQEE